MPLTFATLKQYAQDQHQDSLSAKGLRRHERIVNRALRMIASEKLWTFHRVHHRILLKAKVTIESNITMEPYARVLTLDSGALPSTQAGLSVYVSNATFYFSGDTELMRCQSVNSARTQVTMRSTDVYVASAAASGATGVFVFDRVPLPSNFRELWTPPHERDYITGLTYLTPKDFLYFKQQYAVNDSRPIYYTIQLNPLSNKWELQFWPSPNENRTADLYFYVFPPELTSDTDVALWPEQFGFALFSAIDYVVVQESKDTKRYVAAERCYREAVMRAKELDSVNLSDGPAGGSRAIRGNKIQRSNHFRDVS